MDGTGRVWRFGDDVSTDAIQPSRYMHLRSNLDELATHVFEDVDPRFAGAVAPGDVVVGGKNFGMGSSREHAPLLLKMLGVQAVIARSFARIFYRNAINLGLAAIMCDTAGIEDGQHLDLDIGAGRVRVRETDSVIAIQPMPPVMLRILADGGIVAHLRKHGGKLEV